MVVPDCCFRTARDGGQRREEYNAAALSAWIGNPKERSVGADTRRNANARRLGPGADAWSALRRRGMAQRRATSAAATVTANQLRSYQMAASILAVDDSASMRQMVSFTLKGAGYDVVEAADGVEALGIAKGRKVNLVITDVNMPNMDGITLIKELRSLPSYKFTPLLMLTTESGADKKQQGKAAGATGWIVKPFNPDQLLSTVKKVLG
jgi:two-component system chemotaxis response regulator CheY